MIFIFALNWFIIVFSVSVFFSSPLHSPQLRACELQSVRRSSVYTASCARDRRACWRNWSPTQLAPCLTSSTRSSATASSSVTSRRASRSCRRSWAKPDAMSSWKGWRSHLKGRSEHSGWGRRGSGVRRESDEEVVRFSVYNALSPSLINAGQRASDSWKVLLVEDTKASQDI